LLNRKVEVSESRNSSDTIEDGLVVRFVCPPMLIKGRQSHRLLPYFEQTSTHNPLEAGFFKKYRIARRQYLVKVGDVVDAQPSPISFRRSQVATAYAFGAKLLDQSILPLVLAAISSLILKSNILHP